MVTWEEVYSDNETRENMQFYNKYLAEEQGKRVKEKARQNALVRILLDETKI